MNRIWTAALRGDPARRDREGPIAAAVRLAMSGATPSWEEIVDPDLRRRAGYLVDLAQRMRGQTDEEAARLDDVRKALPHRAAEPFWPGETANAIGADPIAARWGFTRGVNVLRVRAALAMMQRGQRVRLLPKSSVRRPARDMR